MPVELFLPLVQVLPLLLREAKRSITERHGDLQLEANVCSAVLLLAEDNIWGCFLIHTPTRLVPAPCLGSGSPAKGRGGVFPHYLPTPRALFALPVLQAALLAGHGLVPHFIFAAILPKPPPKRNWARWAGTWG